MKTLDEIILSKKKKPKIIRIERITRGWCFPNKCNYRIVVYSSRGFNDWNHGHINFEKNTLNDAIEMWREYRRIYEKSDF